MAIKDYSQTPASNTLNPEGMAAAAVNNNMRQMQADIRVDYDDPEYRDRGHTPVFDSWTAGTKTLVVKVEGSDVTSFYKKNRGIKVVWNATNYYGYISTDATFSTDTTITMIINTTDVLANPITSISTFIFNPEITPVPVYHEKAGETGVANLEYPYDDAKRFGLGDDSTNFSTAIQAAHDSLPANGGTIIIDTGTTLTVNDEVDITKNNVHVIVKQGTILSMSSISGTGTSSIRNATTDVISVFKVTGDNCTVQIDGVISSNNDAVGGKNITAVLIHAADRCKVTGQGKIDNMYCGVWPVKASTNVTIDIKHITGCVFNIGLGSDPTVTADPEVTGVDIAVQLSDAAQSDGIKALSHAYDITIRGGIHRNHTRDGIDLYVGGEYVTIVNTVCTDNGFQGIDCKFGADTTGAGGNNGGYNRRVVIDGNVCNSNTGFGISITDESDDGINDFIVSNNLCSNNTDAGFKLTGTGFAIGNNISADNGTYGYEIASLIDSSLTGNIARNNGTGLTEQKGFFFTKSTLGGKCSGISASANIAIGDATNQTTGFDVRDANVENSTFVGNRSEGHGANNWQTDTSFTNADVDFDWNVGLKTYNHGSKTATTDANGEVTMNHGLHTTPNYVNAHISGDNDYLIHAHTLGATQFKVTVKDSAGADVTSTSVTFYWEARTHGATT